jgi:hypothetical protein
MRALLGEPVRHPVMNGEHGAFPSADSFVHKERLRRGTLLSKLDNVDSTPGKSLAGLLQSATIRQRVRADLSQKLTPVMLGWQMHRVSRERVSVLEGNSEMTQLPGTLQRAQSARKLCEVGYEAAASSLGAPMMLRNLSSSRDNSRETCI